MIDLRKKDPVADTVKDLLQKEGWDDMVKAAKEKVSSGPKPSGGSGVKQGTRYGGSKQKDEPEKKETQKEEVESIEEVSPPGFKGTVKAMKKYPEIDNPFALAWSMKKKGYKSHKKADGSPKNEEVEQIEEKVLDTLKQTVHDSGTNKHVVNSFVHQHPDEEHYNTNTLIHKGTINGKKFEASVHINRGVEFHTKHSPEEKKSIIQHLDRNKYLSKHNKATTNEEFEQIDEISSGLATSYLNKRTAQHKPNLNSPETSNRDAKVAKGISSASRREHGFGPDKSAANKVTSRFDYRKNVGATHTFNKEEVEQLDELKKSTLGSYVKKAAKDSVVQGFAMGDAIQSKNWPAGAKAGDKAKARVKGVERATERLTKEEMESVDEALKGNQHKIDANKNKKIDAHDFKILRAKMKKEETVVEGKTPIDNNVPFEMPYNTTSSPSVKDKSGATHTPMSRVKHIAKMAMKKVKKDLGSK